MRRTDLAPNQIRRSALQKVAGHLLLLPRNVPNPIVRVDVPAKSEPQQNPEQQTARQDKASPLIRVFAATKKNRDLKQDDRSRQCPVGINPRQEKNEMHGVTLGEYLRYFKLRNAET